jgi:cAMP-dependent protein kinase regulator
MLQSSVAAGQSIITQGEQGDNFYVVESGTFAVLVNGHKVTEVGQGGGFGELALLYGQPRAATVTAITDAVVWGVDRLTFRRIVMASTFKKRKEHDTFLKVHTHTHKRAHRERET